MKRNVNSSLKRGFAGLAMAVLLCPLIGLIGAAQAQTVATGSADGYERQEVVAEGRWKDCEYSRESALAWTGRKRDHDAHEKCNALGSGWNFEKIKFEGYQQTPICQGGKTFKGEITQSVAVCRKVAKTNTKTDKGLTAEHAREEANRARIEQMTVQKERADKKVVEDASSIEAHLSSLRSAYQANAQSQCSAVKDAMDSCINSRCQVKTANETASCLRKACGDETVCSEYGKTQLQPGQMGFQVGFCVRKEPAPGYATCKASANQCRTDQACLNNCNSSGFSSIDLCVAAKMVSAPTVTDAKAELSKQRRQEQSAQQKREAKSSSPKPAAAPVISQSGKLMIEVDADCELKIDGQRKLTLKAGVASEVKLEVGRRLLECTSTKDPRVKLRQVQSVAADSKDVLKLPLAVTLAEAKERFKTGPSGTLIDSTTGLQWSQSDNGADITWHKAESYCQAKGGGWGLPNVANLQGIFDSTQSQICGSKTCRVSPKFHLTEYWAWSNHKSGSRAYAVSLVDGNKSDLHVIISYPRRALCVRRP